jgi:hypothetical protein
MSTTASSDARTVIEVKIVVNAITHRLELDSTVTLLDAVRRLSQHCRRDPRGRDGTECLTMAFEYVGAEDVAGAVAMVSADPGASFLAGGTTHLDL